MRNKITGEKALLSINLEKLEDGEHPLVFSLPPAFFDLPTDEVTYPDEIRGRLRLTKTGDNLSLLGKVEFTTEMECSRCLNRYQRELVGEVDILYQKTPPHIKYAKSMSKHTRKVELTTEELKVVEYSSTNLNLSPQVREAIILALPLKSLCKEDCQGLCPKCGKNLNEGMCNCSDNTLLRR
ncbi:MAG: DUF177 domain-containing protein [Candidatus Edwardsbacteria bacterium]